MTKTKSGIYQIKNLITNEIYIGSSKHLASRKAGHFCRLRKGKHQNPILQNHWNKYGSENFEFSVIELCTEIELLSREQFYLDTICPSLNCNPIAGRPMQFIRTYEYKAKMSLAKKGKPHTIKRQKIVFTPERAAKCSKPGELHPGVKLKEEQVLLIRSLLLENVLFLADIAEIFNVTPATIMDIKYNRSWFHLDPLPKINGRAKKRGLSKSQRLQQSKIYESTTK